MKTTKTLLTLLPGLLLSAAAYAQVEVTVTGSTAFRAITIDRSAAIFDPGYVAVTNNTSTGLITYSGTVTTAVPSLGSTPVKVRLSFSGSASGMLAVKNLTQVSTADTPGNNVNRVPDLALSDVFPGSATPPISDSAFERSVLGVIPFVWVINNALTGISNITREQAVLLMTSSGAFTTNGVVGMPATYLGGSSTNPVYLIGRDSGSGTRISTEKDIGFVGAPLLWATNGAGTYITTNGYSSGGLERDVIKGKPDAIGYLGRADLAAIATSATAISYEGVPYSEPAVAGGSYSMWGYEHIVNRVGGLSANQGLVRDALIKAITDSAYQSTPIYTNSFVRLDQMQVERGADGGTITSLGF
jgi:phosphate transport system substrate-binding protein